MGVDRSLIALIILLLCAYPAWLFFTDRTKYNTWIAKYGDWIRDTSLGIDSKVIDDKPDFLTGVSNKTLNPVEKSVMNNIDELDKKFIQKEIKVPEPPPSYNKLQKVPDWNFGRDASGALIMFKEGK